MMVAGADTLREASDKSCHPDMPLEDAAEWTASAKRKPWYGSDAVGVRFLHLPFFTHWKLKSEALC
jgi:hypothetical protein